MKEVRDRVVTDLTQQMALEAAEKKAKEFLEQAQKDGWAEVVLAQELEADSTGPFTRQGTIPKIGQNQELTKAAFSAKDREILPKAYKGDKGYYAVRFTEKVKATDAEFEQEKQNLEKRLVDSKVQTYFYKWLEAVKQDSQIEIKEEYL